MVKTSSKLKSNDSLANFNRPAAFLLDYMRFSLVLSKLRKLNSSPDSDDSEAWEKLGTAPWAEWMLSTEDQAQNTSQRKYVQSAWNFFENNKTEIATVYDCRSFYGLDTPNNLQKRLKYAYETYEKEIDKASASDTNENESGRKGGRPSESQHDQYISEWGLFALAIVKENGGWKQFLKQKNLADIKDIWVSPDSWLKGNSQWSSRERPAANERDTLVQRILYLARDRYIQVLTSVVAPLWGLWFLKNQEHIKLLDRISENKNKNFYIGRPLPVEKLYIDVNTRVGTMGGLPFPFSFADRCLVEHIKRNEIQLNEAWPSKAADTVAAVLEDTRDLKWCPPLLFGGRGDQWRQPDEELANRAVPYISLGGSVKFGSVYKKKSSNKTNLRQMRVEFEPKTWGGRVVNRIEKDNSFSGQLKPLSRIQMTSDFKDSEADLVLSYFPVDLLIQANDKFERMSSKRIYQSFEDKDAGEILIYNLPSTVLAGGMFLARQPKMATLIDDLSTYLYKVEATFRHLSPNWDGENLNKHLVRLQSDSVEEKRDAARELSGICEGSAGNSKMSKRYNLIGSRGLEDLLKDIGEELRENVASDENKEEFDNTFKAWGWAMLLEYVRDMRVFVSCDLF